MEILKLSVKDSFLAFRQEKIAKICMAAYLLILFLTAVFLFLIWKGLPPEMPLFYSLPWGEEQLTTPLALLIIPLGCLLLGFLNFFMAALLFKTQTLAFKILLFMTVILALLGSFTLIKIISLII